MASGWRSSGWTWRVMPIPMDIISIATVICGDGAIREEYHMNYIIDRIDTTATTWMALTLRCGQCHDHKYDPLTTRDYYRFYAFFNNVPEEGLDGTKGNAKPFIKSPTPEQEAQL